MTDRKTARDGRKAYWFWFILDRLAMIRLLLATLIVPFAFLIALSSAFSSCQSHSATNISRIPLEISKIDTMKTRIVIEKSKYQLHLYESDKLLRTYPVVFGGDPVTDKYREGDSRTPEGVFHVRTKYDHAKWSKFIWVDYPTAESYQRFERRMAAGEIPRDATIGGDIGIHGVPEGMDGMIAERFNWTLGCISLTRADVDELYAAIRTGTEIKILH
ncbi:MAG: L,D-transpeptidase [Bacteroidetes bacterium]|nr:L,D-transpeptidase [Bacteroidota bacterium]